ncbi:hypothetical protein [Flavobacterium sp.]|uniref:hypothetical protein n=1 Tax=Flavobacterium sp. TaxID=239 RepID=UPI0037515328
MSAISSIDMYNILKVKLGESEAKALTEYVENRVEKTFEKEIDKIASKEDLLKLEVKLADTKAEIIKWMFIFWIGQVAVTLALVFFKK